MTEYTTGYMCDWCKASAATLDTIDHERDCQRPRILQMMEDLASLHTENARLRAENNERIALLERWVLSDWLGGTDETIFVDTLTALGLDECDADILSLTEKDSL